MGAKMRTFLIGMIIVILVGVGALLWGVANLDSIVKTAIEENGSSITGTRVRVESVTIGLTEGSAFIDSLTIDNPKGYSQSKAFSLESIHATFDPSTSLEVMVIDQLRIEKPEINYELGAKGSNLETLQENVEKSLGSGQSAGTTSSGASKTAEPKFIINKLAITKGKVRLKTGNDKIGSSDIPAIQLSNVGKREGGLTGAEIGEVIIAAMTDKTMQTVTQGAVDKYLGDVEEKIKGLFE